MDVRPLLKSQRKGSDDRHRRKGPTASAKVGGGGMSEARGTTGDLIDGSLDSAGGWTPVGSSEAGTPGAWIAASFDIDEMLSWARDHPQSAI